MGLLFIWTRLNDFASIASAIQLYELWWDHNPQSGNRTKRGGAQQRLLTAVRDWLAHDVKGSLDQSTRPIFFTVVFSTALFSLGVISIVFINVLNGASFHSSLVFVHSINVLLLVIDEFLLGSLTGFGFLELSSYATGSEKLIAFFYTVSSVAIIGRLVGYLVQSMITILLVCLLPLSVIRKAKEIRTHTNEFGLRSSTEVLKSKGPNAVKKRRAMDFVGMLLDFQKNVWEKPVQPN